MDKNITLEESGMLLSIYERALMDYTYLTSDHQFYANAVQRFKESV